MVLLILLIVPCVNAITSQGTMVIKNSPVEIINVDLEYNQIKMIRDVFKNINIFLFCLIDLC